VVVDEEEEEQEEEEEEARKEAKTYAYNAKNIKDGRAGKPYAPRKKKTVDPVLVDAAAPLLERGDRKKTAPIKYSN
jgi:hypothetical protein